MKQVNFCKFDKENEVKQILINNYGKKYSLLKKSESPDFQSNSLGLEITNATEEIEFGIFYKKNCNKQISEIKEKLLNKNKNNKRLKLVFNNTKLNGYKTKYFTNSFSFMENVINILNKKLKLLNTIYTIFKQNEIAIIVDLFLDEILIDKEEIETEIIYELKKCYNFYNNKYKFDTIHLIFKDNLLCVKTKNWNYKTKKYKIQ